MPTIIVHDQTHARVAVAAASALGCPLTLASAPGAGAFAGAGWFLALIREASAPYPAVAVTAVLDCGDQPGAVLAGIRAGCRHLRFTGRADVAARLADLAAQAGAALVEDLGTVLDLAQARDPEAACRSWLTAQPPSSGHSDGQG